MNEDSLERRVARRFLPFAAVGLLALATIALPPEPKSWTLVAAAVALTIAISLAGVTIPWSRMPRATYVVPPLAYFVVIGLLRDAQGGSTSGYAPLAIVPILWIALTLGRREVAIGVAGGVALFVIPLVGIGGEVYTATEWRRAVLWSGVALLVGFSTESLVRNSRQRARDAEKHMAELAESERTMAAIARVVREAAARSETRDFVCEAAVEVAGATVATIVEPDGPEWLIVTASAGLRNPPIRVRVGENPSGSELVFATGSRLFIPDVRADLRLASRLTTSAPEVVSALFEPIVRGGRTVGVLAVGWPERVDTLTARQAQAVLILAAEAGAAIELADALARLRHLSLTDELMQLPNRRAWEEELPRAMARASRWGSPLSIALLDLDRFKEFNDANGHQAGDELLRGAAAAWGRSLRSGDLLARFGGDELAALLPDADLRSACRVAERMRAATPHGQTSSIGVATWNGGESIPELIRRADAALYTAKRAGRNRVEAAGPSSELSVA